MHTVLAVTFNAMVTLAKRQAASTLMQKIALRKRHGKALSQDGFTLVELLIVVVILGVLSAVGVPAYLNQQVKAKINSANAAAMGAAKACAAAQITGDEATFVTGGGVSGTCAAAGTASEFESDSAKFTGISTQATATVGTDGSVSLTTEAAQ
jgi:type IV pilus assembly protein PilA